MSTDRLTPDDADQMRDFAGRCSRVANTAQGVAEAEAGEAAYRMNRVAIAALELRAALLDAARFADPDGEAPADG